MPTDLTSSIEFIESSDFYQILSGKIPHSIAFIESSILSTFCISNKISTISFNEKTDLISYQFIFKLANPIFVESTDFYYRTPGKIAHYNIIFTENANFLVKNPILLKGKVYYAIGLREYLPRTF